jgi:Family of unknown function (DUF5677)
MGRSEERTQSDADELNAAGQRAIETVDIIVRNIETIKEAAEGKARTIPEERLDTFSIIWGWWMRILRLGELVAIACKQGLAAEASPLVRSMSEHVMALLWLSDEGEAARAAITAARAQHQRRLVQEMHAADWKSDALTHFSLPDPPTSTVQLEQITNFRLMFGSYVGGMPYAAYCLESATTHPTYDSAAGYFVEAAPATLSIEISSAAPSESAALLAAVFVLTALMVLQSEVADDGLDALIDNGCGSRGVTAEPVWSARCAGM